MRKNNSDEFFFEDELRNVWRQSVGYNFPNLTYEQQSVMVEEIMKKEIKPRTILVDKIIKMTQDSSHNMAMVYNDLDLFLLNYKENLEDKISFIKLDQKVVSYNKAIWLPHHHLIYSTFKKKINQLIEGGFFNHWMNPYFSHQSILDEEIVDDKVVLTMDHLSVGFTIWLGILFIATVAFAAEFVHFNPFNLIGGFVIDLIVNVFNRVFICKAINRMFSI